MRKVIRPALVAAAMVLGCGPPPTPTPLPFPTPTTTPTSPLGYAREATVANTCTGGGDLTSCLNDEGSSGEAILFGDGTFNYSGVITISNGTHFYCAHDGGTEFVAGDRTNMSFYLTGNAPLLEGCHISTTLVNDRRSTPESTCISLSGSTNAHILNNKVENCASAGIFAWDDNGENSGYVIAGNWVLQSLADCIHNVNVEHDYMVEYNRVEKCGDDGIANGAYSRSSRGYNFKVFHNDIYDQTYARGISFFGSHDGEVAFNHVENPAGCTQDRDYTPGHCSAYAGIMWTVDRGYGGSDAPGSYNVDVHDNTVINRGSTLSGHGALMIYDGVGDPAMGNNTLNANQVKDSGKDCILLNGSAHPETVTNNNCYGTGGQALNNSNGSGGTYSNNNGHPGTAYPRDLYPLGQAGPWKDPAFP